MKSTCSILLLLPLLFVAGCQSRRILVPNDVVRADLPESYRVSWVETLQGERYEFEDGGGRIYRRSDIRIVVSGIDRDGVSRLVLLSDVLEIGVSSSVVDPGVGILGGVVALFAVAFINSH